MCDYAQLKVNFSRHSHLATCDWLIPGTILLTRRYPAPMPFLIAASIVPLLAIPQSRSLIEPLVDQAEHVIGANLPLLFAGLLVALGATFLSWLGSRWPPAEMPQSYRVIKRFRIQ
jgi:hypothetical protein